MIRRHGLEADVDFIRLKILCQKGDADTRKASLKQTISKGAKTRISGVQSTENSPPLSNNKSTLNIVESMSKSKENVKVDVSNVSVRLQEKMT